MSRIHLTRLGCLLVTGLLGLAASTASAQGLDDSGYVRITDSTPAHVTQAGHHHHGAVVSECPNCPHGGEYIVGSDCPQGGCPGGYHCGHGKCAHCVRQILDWFNPHGMYTFSPDHGFAPPAKRPIYRSPVVYRKMFPNAWTGQPDDMVGGQTVPSVYMPTDTTQLGYYYQHVPYWLPKAGAVPPTPRPNEWHTSMCEVNLPGHHPAGVIWGTAPTAHPMPIVESTQGIPPMPAEAEPTQVASPMQNGPMLERSASNPQLLPIE